jgi:hypothetical protein
MNAVKKSLEVAVPDELPLIRTFQMFADSRKFGKGCIIANCKSVSGCIGIKRSTEFLTLTLGKIVNFRI